MRRAVRWALVILLIPAAAILGGALVSPSCQTLANRDTVYDVAVVLGAGMAADGRLFVSSRERVEAGAALVLAGRAHRLHSTGGRLAPGGPISGEEMAKHAISLGVDPGVVTFEGDSHSTLQNALYSIPYLKDAGSIALVSEGFHLSRGWISMAWAGLTPSAICHSTRFSKASPDSRLGGWYTTPREYLAFWFNLFRAGYFTLATALGQDPDAASKYLQ